ncbi:MAG: SEC-C metal-binding domain-containing protein [Acidimicrobiia bacterium]|nr:SEC-C metal-binding domain-containing protein [Acidimicrobiia bacterium]
MELDRGTLARIDRKLLAGLGQDERFQMVRVPVTAAKWATWKRYCEAAGISMGRAILALIDRELVSVFGQSTGEDVPLLAGRAEGQLAAREAQVHAREREIKVSEGRLRRQDERLRHWEEELEAREQRTELTTRLSARPAAKDPKVGRNERCPCGSGLKHKHCHGIGSR